jgi:hypothetical protein
MVTLVVEPLFRDFLPRLAQEEYDLLEADIRQRGVLDKVKVWRRENCIVDGHHRYEIATKHGIPFEMEYLDFGDRTDVLFWMMRNQNSRRQLSWRARVAAAFKVLKESNIQDGITIDPPPHQVAKLSGVSIHNVEDHLWLMENNPEQARAMEDGSYKPNAKRSKLVAEALDATTPKDYGLDVVGQPIPSEKIALAFVAAKSDLAVIERDASRLFAKLRAHANGPHAAYLTVAEVDQVEARIAKLVTSNIPYCVCLSCKGSGMVENERCRDCGGHGWWTKERFSALAPQDFKNQIRRKRRKEK